MKVKRRLPDPVVFGCVLILLLLLCPMKSGAGLGTTASMAIGPVQGAHSDVQADTFSAPDTWATRTSMPTVRGNLGLAPASNGRLYAIGGYRGSGRFYGVVEEYDPAADTWTTRASMPTPRKNMGVATASNGKIYAIGGYDYSQLDTVEEYDPATDTWTTRSSMPTVRAGVAVAAASNGKIYAFGGISGSSYVNTVQEYDPATDSWTTRASMPTARGHLAAAQANNGKIYVIGGRDKMSGTFRAVGTVEEYDPATDTWTTCASMPLPRYELGVLAASNGRVYAIGGRDYVGFGGYTFYAEYERAEEYDPATDTWTRRADMPTARAGVGVAQAKNGLIYAVGGSDYGFTSDTYYDVVEEYTPPSYGQRASISKKVTPQGQVEYGDELAYTLVLSATPGIQVGLYDPLTDATFARFIAQPQGITHSDGVITGTVTITPTNQVTISFGVRVDVPVTAGSTVTVTNRGCVYLVGESLDGCVWSNEVANPAFRPYSLYLPLLLRGH